MLTCSFSFSKNYLIFNDSCHEISFRCTVFIVDTQFYFQVCSTAIRHIYTPHKALAPLRLVRTRHRTVVGVVPAALCTPVTLHNSIPAPFCPSPSRRATIRFFSGLFIYFVLIPRLSRITRYSSCLAWLTSLCIAPSRSVHVIARGEIPPF